MGINVNGSSGDGRAKDSAEGYPQGSVRGGGRLAVRLVPFAHEDCERLAGWVRSPAELFAWSGNTFIYPLDIEQLEAHLERESAHNHIFKAVPSENEAPVGHCELYLGERERGTGTACRLLIDPARRGEGLGGATMEALLDHAFRVLRLDRVELQAFADSPEVIRFHRRLGFKPERLRRNARRFGEKYHSLLVMRLLEPEWRALRAERVAT